FANLEQWIVDGVEPPPSQVPRLGDGTAVSREKVLDRFRSLPGVALPTAQSMQAIHRLDLGPDAPAGVGRWPLVQSDPYPVLVSDIDDDGNEVAGIAVPEVAVPVATFTA